MLEVWTGGKLVGACLLRFRCDISGSVRVMITKSVLLQRVGARVIEAN